MIREQIIILGFGGNAVDFFDTISSNYDIIGFVDDDKSRHGLSHNGIYVQGRELLDSQPQAKIISMIGSEKTFKVRHEIIDNFHISKDRFATVIHPSASVSSSAVIGKDVAIMPGVIITSNAKVGDHIFILANTVLHHDVEIGDNTLIGSNVTMAGHVKIGTNCFVGSGTSIKNNTTIGSFSIIGMGSNVIRSVGENSRIAGNPAKPL